MTCLLESWRNVLHVFTPVNKITWCDWLLRWISSFLINRSRNTYLWVRWQKIQIYLQQPYPLDNLSPYRRSYLLLIPLGCSFDTCNNSRVNRGSFRRKTMITNFLKKLIHVETIPSRSLQEVNSLLSAESLDLFCCNSPIGDIDFVGGHNKIAVSAVCLLAYIQHPSLCHLQWNLRSHIYDQHCSRSISVIHRKNCTITFLSLISSKTHIPVPLYPRCQGEQAYPLSATFFTITHIQDSLLWFKGSANCTVYIRWEFSRCVPSKQTRLACCCISQKDDL